MKKAIAFLAVMAATSAWQLLLHADEPRSVDEALRWLDGKAKEMVQAGRRTMPDGAAAYPPQVGPGYDAFWLRDYEYMLEGSIDAFSNKDLVDACMVLLNGQKPDGACIECVKLDGKYMFKPGYDTMGENPVADGSQFMVSVAWRTYRKVKDPAFVTRIVERLVKAMNATPRNPQNGLVHIKPQGWDRCGYGFTDSVKKQGDELFCSLLYYDASRQLADLLDVANRPAEAAQWRQTADRVAQSIRSVFWNESIGLFDAATLQCKQPDIWGSAFAVYLGVASKEQSIRIARYFQKHYREIVYRGQIRQLPGGMYWQSSLCGHDGGQNGGYWATATGWFVYTLDLVDPRLADQTVLDMVRDFQQRGVLEWIFAESKGVPHYLANVTLPIDGIRKMLARRKAVKVESR